MSQEKENILNLRVLTVVGLKNLLNLRVLTVVGLRNLLNLLCSNCRGTEEPCKPFKPACSNCRGTEEPFKPSVF